ncbi:3,4-dihydroxy-2-butanone-4-phosphate synthase [Rhodococcus sp. JVH1]|uniref:3,4-dihydroxy-2-butanone-4-phosphate synthase n=1 Tax=Rhodococcus sp. JVH1 TaxID=745408 RepID=UPI0012F68A3E
MSITETPSSVLEHPDAHTATSGLSRAVRDIASGRPVVVVDDADRENEGDLVFAAQYATPELMAFMIRHTSGFVCVAMPETVCDELVLPPMYWKNEEARQTAYCVTVDAADGVGTGISATDRATTIRLLANPSATRHSFCRPGHVVPLRARPGGVLERPGHTEAAVRLAEMADLVPCGVLCEIVSTHRPTEMANFAELCEFADQHNLTMISVSEIVEYDARTSAAGNR